MGSTGERWGEKWSGLLSFGKKPIWTVSIWATAKIATRVVFPITNRLFWEWKPSFWSRWGIFSPSESPLLDNRFGRRVTRGINFSLHQEITKNPMNLLLIILCFVMAYGVFALIAFKIVKVLFPNSESNDKPWKVRIPWPSIKVLKSPGVIAGAFCFHIPTRCGLLPLCFVNVNSLQLPLRSWKSNVRKTNVPIGIIFLEILIRMLYTNQFKSTQKGWKWVTRKKIKHKSQSQNQRRMVETISCWAG